MTIRIRCAECQRKLKVPDEALGKKVQCPACGARFRGRVDADPPPAPPVESPPPLQHPPLEMMAAAPFMNLELEAPAMDAEPAPEAVEPLVVEEAAEETAESEALDSVVLDDEPADEVEVAEAADEDEPKKKKSRGLLYVCLAGVAVVMLLGCGGVGFVAYRYVNGTLFESSPSPPAREKAEPRP